MSRDPGETLELPVERKRGLGGRLLRLAAGLAAIGAVGAAGYFGYDRFLTEDDASTGERTLVPVQRGDLTDAVSVNGSIVFPERETVRFETPGTLGLLLVDEGDAVEEGQALAVLDEGTLADLERAVAQAEVALRDAKEKLADLGATASELAIAQAEADVASAAQKVEDLIAPASDLAIAQAEADVADAKQRVEDLLAPASDLAIAEAEAAVQRAEESLAATEAALAELTGGDLEAAATEAQENARVDRENAAEQLRLDEQTWAARVSDAETVLADAETAYADALHSWLGVDADTDLTGTTPEALLESWGASYTSIFVATSESLELPADDPATPWNDFTVALWMNVYPGEVLATCAEPPGRGTRCVQQELDDGWDAAADANGTLEQVRLQSAQALNASSGAVSKAEAAVEAADAALADVLDPATGERLEADVAVAVAKLSDAEEKLAELVPAEAESIEDADVVLARARLVDAEEKLADLRADREEDPDIATELALARARLDDAEQALADLADVGSDELVLSLAQIDVSRAEIALADASAALSGAALRAPFAGEVAAVLVDEGQRIDLQTAVVEIVDRSVVEVDAIVDEIDVLSVSVGSPALVLMDALPGGGLDGTVWEIGDAANSSQGVVTYPISVRVEVPEGIVLREGLSATASVVVQEVTDTLMVPNAAVSGSFAEPTVDVVRGGAEETVAVELGITDGFWVAVHSGLADGDEVYMPTPGETAATATGFGAGGFGGGAFGGGFGGSSDFRALRELQGGFGGGFGGVRVRPDGAGGFQITPGGGGGGSQGGGGAGGGQDDGH